MDATHALILAVGMVVAWKASKRVLLARIAWNDYKTTKAKVPVLLKLARALIWTAAGRVLILLLVALAVVAATILPPILEAAERQ